MLVCTSVHASDRVLPDLKLTPGVVNTAVTDVCAIKWGRDERHVSLAMKRHVFAEYGIPYARHSHYEVDHLISRELGGADDIRNLWPESYAGPFGAHEKDRLENRLHKLVCARQLVLAQAQREIAADWTAAFRHYLP